MKTDGMSAVPNGMPGALVRIRSIYPGLSPSERKVADYVLANTGRTVYFSVTQLADICDVSESTVIRFCQAVGYRGYHGLKLALARELGESAKYSQATVRPDDSLAALAQKIASSNVQSIKDTTKVLDLDALERAIEAILNASRVEFYGVGASGFTAGDAMYKFMRIGVQCAAVTDSHLQAMSASTLKPGDVAVGISQSGSTRDVVDSCQMAKRTGATVICITSHARSPIAKVADIVLMSAVNEAPLESGALRSKIAQVYVLDLLYTGVFLRSQSSRNYIERTAEAVVDKLY